MTSPSSPQDKEAMEAAKRIAGGWQRSLHPTADYFEAADAITVAKYLLSHPLGERGECDAAASPRPSTAGSPDAADVERVARAIYEADPSYDCGPWEDLLPSDFAHSICIQQARAAIAAMPPPLSNPWRSMESALRKAAEQFEFYAREHRAKAASWTETGQVVASLNKAVTNDDMAAMCRAALPPAPEQSEDVK